MHYQQIPFPEARIVGITHQADNALILANQIEAFYRPTLGHSLSNRARPLPVQGTILGFGFGLDKLAKSLKEISCRGHNNFS
jgi:hypothetical protein